LSKVILIASVCHALNAALCVAIGDNSQPAWADAPDWQRASAIAGVEMHLANPDATPEQSHESWMAQKTAEGWAYGEVKDPEKKLHPCFRPYAELPEIQRAKDHVFKACVHALKDLPLEQVQAAAAAVVPLGVPKLIPATSNGFLPVRYIGRRNPYRDGAYGTGIVFAPGETRMVPVDKARLMFKHPDVYEPGELLVPQQTPQDAPIGATVDPDLETQRKEEERIQDVRDVLNAMQERDAVAEFVQQNFNQKLDKRRSLADLKAMAIQLVDQYGIGK
jgi:hypothetical protein